MLEHARCIALVVHSERYGMGEHISKDADTISHSLHPEGPVHAQGSATQSPKSIALVSDLQPLDNLHKAIRSAPLMCFASWLDASALT